MAVAMAENALPTDVVANFGVWLENEPANTTCGHQPSAFPPASMCPNMASVCKWFSGDMDALALSFDASPEQPPPKNYNLFWAATTPAFAAATGTMEPVIPSGHALNVPEVCRCYNSSFCLLFAAHSVTAYHTVCGRAHEHTRSPPNVLPANYTYGLALLSLQQACLHACACSSHGRPQLNCLQWTASLSCFKQAGQCTCCRVYNFQSNDIIVSISQS
jgi:hypothetical protein